MVYKNIISKLTRQGYLIDKSSLTSNEISELKKKLLVTPKIKNNYGNKDIESFPIYLENQTKICIPKFFGLKEIGEPKEEAKYNYDKIELKFNGQLKERQIEPYTKTIEGLEKKNGGVLSIPCGWGKTVLGLKIISHFNVKTLIIVHKTFLVNQWKERISQFLPNARIGMIQQDNIDIEDKDIVIGMLQSISMKNYDKKVFSSFGMVIIDEVHRISSKIFSRALHKTSTKYTLGLSATPEREDGLSKIFHWYLGDMLYQKTQEGNKSVVIKCYNFKANHNKFRCVINNFTKKPNSAKMISNLMEIDSRNNNILELIYLLLKDKRRQILILSDRIDHLTLLKDNLDKLHICTTGYYIGKMKENELNDSSTKNVIFGTYPMASEGLDIPSLNTLILATPRSNIVQSVGRILRRERTDLNPIVIDIIDNIPPFMGQGYKRKKFYKSMGYIIDNVNMVDDKIINYNGDDKIKELDDTLIINTIKKEEKEIVKRLDIKSFKFSE